MILIKEKQTQQQWRPVKFLNVVQQHAFWCPECRNSELLDFKFFWGFNSVRTNDVSFSNVRALADASSCKPANKSTI